MRAAVIDIADLRELPDGGGWRCGPVLVRLRDPHANWRPGGTVELAAMLDGLTDPLLTETYPAPGPDRRGVIAFVHQLRDLWPAPLLCPACGTVAVPVRRVGYGPWEQEVRDGDAVYASGCVVLEGDQSGPDMPLQCRKCRRHLAAPDDEDTLAAVALDTYALAPAGRAGLWRREDGRVLAWTSPLAPAGAVGVPVPAEVRGLLRAARCPVAVLRVAGTAARFASGRDLRAGLAAGDTFDLSARGFSSTVGGQPVKLALRPPRVRATAGEPKGGDPVY